MAFSDKYKKRAVHLLINGNPFKTALQILEKEFEDQPQPTERSLSRWKKDPRFSIPDIPQEAPSNNGLSKEQNERRVQQHFEQMASIAEALLGDLDVVEYKGEDNYELIKAKNLTLSLRQYEVVKRLKDNLYRTQAEFRSMGLFQHFLTHLEGEEHSCRELDRYVEEHPLEFINLLKMLVITKVFKGTCPICRRVADGSRTTHQQDL